MNDRELLELAAKAVGGKHDHGTDCITMDVIEYEQWNPIEDDGDALRLAVKLDFCITQWRNHSEYPPHVMVGYKTGPTSASNWVQEYEGDEMAANRRAIVRAAAEIGKAMP